MSQQQNDAGVSAAKAEADSLRLPLVVVAAETHEVGRTFARENGAFDGNSVVLSVPQSAPTDFNFLSAASNSSEVPRMHIFPPSGAQNPQPSQFSNTIGMTYVPLTVFGAAQVRGDGQDVQQVRGNFQNATQAWANVQNDRRPGTNVGSPTRSSPTSASSPTTHSVVSPTTATSSSSSSKPTTDAAAASSASSKPPTTTTTNTTTTSATSSTHVDHEIRIVPKVNIRIHNSSAYQPPQGTFHIAPQPRDRVLPVIRQHIAQAAASSFGNNFHFIQQDSLVRVHNTMETKQMASDVCNGSTLYIAPNGSADAALPVASSATATTSSTASSSATAAASTTTTTTKTSTDSAPSSQNQNQNQTSTTTTTTKTAAGGSRIRIRITFPDGSEQISAFTTESTANDVAEVISQKIGHNSFYMTLPQRRIREDELTQNLSQLGIRGSVALRVYDVDAMRERAQQYEQEKKENEETEKGGMMNALSGMMSRLRGQSNSSSQGDVDDNGGEEDNKNNAPPSNTMGQRPPHPSQHPSSSSTAHHGSSSSGGSGSGGVPHSMVEMRRQQEEEEERKKKPGGNTYYGGSSTNFETRPDDKK